MQKAIILTSTKSKTETTSYRILKIMLFASLTIIGAKIEIPTYPVPFTLQTLFVILSGAFLGKKDGFYAQSLYLMIGIIGLPVFTGPIAGIAKLYGPTGGYLLSFPLAAYIAGYFLKKGSSNLTIWVGAILSVLIIYLFGVVHLSVLYTHNFYDAIVSGLAIFSVWQIVKLTAAVFIFKKLKK
jgi:biotin transport system substrate-specific component